MTYKGYIWVALAVSFVLIWGGVAASIWVPEHEEPIVFGCAISWIVSMFLIGMLASIEVKDG